jgi:hypothetical protein
LHLLSNGSTAMAVLSTKLATIFCGCAGSNDGDILKSSDELHGGTCDYWGAKIDADSNIQFKFHYGGTASDVARTVLETSDGNYIVGGSAQSNDVNVVGHIGPYGDPDFWVLKINSSAQILWQKCYGGTTYDDFGSIILTPDNGYALCGGTSSNDHDVSGNHGSSDYWLLKVDNAGNIQWQKCYGDSGYEKAFDVKLCGDGGYIMAGFTSSWAGQVVGNHSLDFDGWVVKTDADGNLQWAKCFGGTGQDGFYKVKQLNDGNFLAAGYTYSIDGDITNGYATEFRDDAWLVLIDPNGNLLWSKAFGGDSTDEFSSIQQDQLGEILVSGYSKSKEGDLSLNYGGYDYWFMSVDENGNILWDSTYGGPFDDVCNDLAVANDGRVALIGYTASDSIDVSGNHGFIYPGLPAKKDYWVVDLGSVVGIHEIPKSTLTVIPSLAHDMVQISSNDLAEENSFITVRNESGQLVLNKIMNHQSQLLLDISSLSSGIYFIEAKNEKMNAVSKFVKM